MNVTAAVKTRVKAKLVKCHKMAEAHYGRTFDFPSIEYTVTGSTGGKAWGSKRVGFNPTLLMENVDKFIGRTVPHELAHCIDYVVNPRNHSRAFGKKRTVHGNDWKRVMRVLGAADATRCHKYDTSSVRRKTHHEWTCNDCAGKMELGPVRHKKMLAASDKGCYRPSGRRCTWDHTYSYVGVVGATPAPPAPKKPKVPKKAAASHNRSGSKKARAEAIYQRSPATRTRSEMIARFVASLDMTPAGAATYYANCKKKFG